MIPMKIVIAPNSFKNSLDAYYVSAAMKKGFSNSRLKAEYLLFPIADGGDHTVDVICRWFDGVLITERVNDPLGRQIEATWGLIRHGRTAVIEMAKASGVALLKENELNPFVANSYGAGQLILRAVERGVEEIILGIGGSATVDAGLGMLQALGAKLLDNQNREIGRNVNPLIGLHSIDLDGMDKRLKKIRFNIMCDVDNPLLGPAGAAKVFGPQKGASPDQVLQLEELLKTFNQIVVSKTGVDLSKMPCGGAAGGISVALKSFLNAELVNGIDYLLEIMGFDKVIRDADLLVTAEGRADHQTLTGKGPSGVAQKAAEYDVPTILLAGQIEDIDKLNSVFQSVFPIANGVTTLENALKTTADDLERTCHQLGNLLAMGKIE